MKKIFLAVIVVLCFAVQAMALDNPPATISMTPYVSSAGDLMANLDIRFSDGQSQWNAAGMSSFMDGYELYFVAQIQGALDSYFATMTPTGIDWSGHTDIPATSSEPFGGNITPALSLSVPDGALSNASLYMPIMIAPASLLAFLGTGDFMVNVILRPIDNATGWTAGTLSLSPLLTGSGSAGSFCSRAISVCFEMPSDAMYVQLTNGQVTSAIEQ